MASRRRRSVSTRSARWTPSWISSATALGFELLGIEEVYCSELPLTSGRVRSSHGSLPVPAPATLELLKDSGVVWKNVPGEGELVTPTGAAVIATLAQFGRPDRMTIQRVGYGFGQKRLPWANCLRLLLGETRECRGRLNATRSWSSPATSTT